MRIMQRTSTDGIPQVRRGFTLTEVLIAMFVLALGMMGVLALFPLGAAQMAQAVKDERTAQLAEISEAHFRMIWRTAWLDNNGLLDTDMNALGGNPNPPNPAGKPGEPAFMALDNTNYNYYTPTTNYPGFQADPITVSHQSGPQSGSPSYPVYIDPIGYNVQPSTNWVYPNALPRRSIISLKGGSITAPIRLFSLMDDISFNPTGLAGNPVQRGGRYNAAYLIQRPKNNVRQEVNLQVVVYQNRPIDVPLAETVLGSGTTSFPDLVSVNGAAGLPTLRKGSWILLLPTNSNEAFADFYRVVGYTKSGNTYNISVSPSLRNHFGSGNYSAYVMTLDGVVEVFDRGNITPYEVPAH